jgi:DNA topoisomerase-1
MDKEDAFMPQLIEGDKLFPLKRRVQPIDTTPPKRFTCASLVEELEDMGIGRPSTYATIFSTLIELHHYVEKIKNQKSLRPTTNGMLVVESLSSTNFVETDYSSKMEDQLDSISSGSGQYRTVLENASSAINEDLIRVSMPEDEALLRNVKRCPLCNSPMRKRTGSHGEFWGCTSYPNCKHAEQCVDDKKDGKKRAKK